MAVGGHNGKEPPAIPQKVPATVLAGFLDVSPQRVTQMALEGLVKKTGRGEFLFLESVRAVVRRLRDRSNDTNDRIAEQRLRQATADADTAVMDRDERREELMPVAWWIAALEQFGAEAKAIVMATDLSIKAKQEITAKLAELKPSRIFAERKGKA